MACRPASASTHDLLGAPPLAGYGGGHALPGARQWPNKLGLRARAICHRSGVDIGSRRVPIPACWRRWAIEELRARGSAVRGLSRCECPPASAAWPSALQYARAGSGECGPRPVLVGCGHAAEFARPQLLAAWWRCRAKQELRQPRFSERSAVPVDVRRIASLHQTRARSCAPAQRAHDPCACARQPVAQAQFSHRQAATVFHLRWQADHGRAARRPPRDP